MKLHIYLSKGKCKIGVLTLIVLHHHPVVSISSIVRTDLVDPAVSCGLFITH